MSGAAPPSIRRRLCALAAGTVLAAGVAAAADTEVALVIEAGGEQHHIAGSALEALPRVTLQISFHGDEPEDIPAVTLPSVLSLVGIKAQELHNNELGRVVLVEAADGYRVAFGIAELDPNISGRQVYLSARDTSRGRSWRILVPGDGRGARWVRDVVRIQVIDPGAGQP